MDIPRRTKGSELSARAREREKAAAVCKFLGLADTGFGGPNLHGPRICGGGGDGYLRQRFLLDCPRLLRLTFLSLSLA